MPGKYVNFQASGSVNFLSRWHYSAALGAIPWNKGFLRGEWEWHHFDFVVTGNYTGDFRDDPAFLRDFKTLYPGQQRTVPSYITLDMQLSYEFVKPPTEPSPYVKESKDSKNAPLTEAATASIWQRMLWGHQNDGRRQRRLRPLSAVGHGSA
jgi:hypothetical protein